ncbi:hypothetical protein V2J09_018707 [Rumex salicifolius]
MDECRRKLALWHTRTFKPIMIHDDLDPIMSNLGFVGLPPKPAPSGVVWKEYFYAAGGCRAFVGRLKWLTSDPAAETDDPVLPPKLRLPYPRIDGLHIYTYRAFLDAVGFYLKKDDVSDLFHVRGMAFNRVHDRMKKYRAMEEESMIVYAEGSLDPSTYDLYHADKSVFSTDDDENKAHGNSSLVIRSKDNTASVGTFVPFKNIFVKLDRSGLLFGPFFLGNINSPAGFDIKTVKHVRDIELVARLSSSATKLKNNHYQSLTDI